MPGVPAGRPLARPRWGADRGRHESGAGAPPSRRFLVRATLVTAGLTVAGALLGLARDRVLARFFGAGSGTDAFLVAWTVPEVASTLLIEDGMAFLLVPAFSSALARRARRAARTAADTPAAACTPACAAALAPDLAPDPDPLRVLVTVLLPRLLLALSAVAVLTAAGAPLLVRLLAPGLPEPAVAVDCMRLTATCALSFGAAGYCSAALRAHRSFVPPAAIYVAYNVGIIAAMTALGGALGVRAAAVGVAAGGCLMTAVQVPALRRRLRHTAASRDPYRTVPPDPHTTAPPGPYTTASPGPHTAAHADPHTTAPPSPHTTASPGPHTAAHADPHTAVPVDRRESARPASRHGTARPADRQDTAHRADRGGTARPAGRRGVGGTLVAVVFLFALCRQSQVLVERYLASSLPPGAISHLNYAQKVAQVPMALSLMLCAVTFPVVARALAAGDREQAGDRVERDLALAGCVVLLGTAALVACAPAVLALLFQNGAFTTRDTAATAAVLRVYALGLLGHTLVGALARAYFAAGRCTCRPLGAMAAGAAGTAVLGAWAAGPWGARGVAAGNAAGITVTALLMLYGLRRGGGARDGSTGRRRHTSPAPGPRLPAVRVCRVLRVLAAQVTAAVCGCGAGLCAARQADGAVATVALSGTSVGAVFALVLAVLWPSGRAAAVRAVRALRPARRPPAPSPRPVRTAPPDAPPHPTHRHPATAAPSRTGKNQTGKNQHAL